MKALVLLLSTFALNSFALAALFKPQLPTDIVALHKVLHATGCDMGIDVAGGFQAYPISEGTNLYIVPCMNGAYNSTSVAYLKQGSQTPEPVYVLMQYPAIEIENSPAAIVSTPYLTDAVWDMESHYINTYSKGRGMGDCGQSSSSKVMVNHFGGAYVKTVEIRSKQECDGNTESEWPIVYKQD